MYLYFDRTGTLKEVINDEESIRIGNHNVNQIFVYVDGVDVETLWVRFKLPNNTYYPLITAELEYTDTVTQRISFNKERDLKFFNYSDEYTFFYFTVPDEALGLSGTDVCSMRVNIGEDELLELGDVLFYVQKSALESVGEIEYDGYVSLAQYNELITAVGNKATINYVDNNFIKVGDGIQIFTATNTTTFAQLYVQTGTKEFILFYNNTYYIGRFRSETNIYMETISNFARKKELYFKNNFTSTDRVSSLFSYDNRDNVALSTDTIWYTSGSDTTDLDSIVDSLEDYGHDATKPFIFKLTSSQYGYEGYYLCQANTLGRPNCIFIFRQIDGINIFQGVVGSFPNYNLKDFFKPEFLSTQTTQEYVDENFLSKDNGGNVEGDVAFGGIVTVVTPTQNSEVANKGYVDNAIQEFLQNEYQAVDTTEYPTLNSFLASTGEEGYIYLYPINVNDESQGYYQYIWEDDSWVSLGTTRIDLSNYYTKSETDTLLNAKANISDVYTKTETDTLLNNKQDTLVSGTNIKTLNGTSLLGSGNIAYDDELDSSSTNAVQNKVITQNVLDLQYRVSVLEEAIVSEDTLSYTYLSESLIPTLSDNSYPIIQSGGLDTKEIKGRSFVYNQAIPNTGTHHSYQSWTIDNSSGSSALYATRWWNCGSDFHLTIGHKYLLCFLGTKSYTGSGTCALYSSVANQQAIVFNFRTQTANIITINSIEALSSVPTFNTIVGAGTTLTVDGYLMLFDLTQSGIDSATTVDQATALLQQNGINPYEYNPYNAGKIIDSKPTAIVSKGYNLFDGELEIGGIDSDGTLNTSTLGARSKNYIKVASSKTYTFEITNNGGNTIGTYFVCEYDKNKNFIQRVAKYSNNSTFELSANTHYVKVFFYCSTTATITNVQICFHITGTRTGYKPYKAPITYPLDVPVLRSAGSVQDNNEKANIGVYTFTGNENWQPTSSGYVYYFFLSGIKSNPTTNVKSNILCSILENKTFDQLNQSGTTGIANTYDRICISASDYTNRSNLTGKTLYYELATSTDQPTITLPENMEIELGGSLEVLYDDGHTTPCDFTFDTAVYKPIQ